MRDTRKRIGANIRSIRHLRGISADALAKQLSEKIETDISGDAILTYETGKRPITAEMLIEIADVLNCSVQALLDGADYRLGEVKEPKREIGKLSPGDHNILRDVATKWNGNIHALIVSIGIYCALPPHRRREAMMELMSQMSFALRDGEITVADLPEGIAELEKETGGLYG